MDLIVAWALFPFLLTALATGCGLLIEVIVRRRLPTAILPGCGFAVIVVATQFATIDDGTAQLIVPIAVALAIAGLGLGLPRRIGRGWPAGALAGAGVFAVYAAPIVLSGAATFAGYIRLDDTATWMALTDRVMEHGRSLDGLAPSTYEATLAFNLGDGYPIGVFLPLGVGVELTATDVAWLIQPYMAWVAAVLGLALWQLAALVLASTWIRAGVAIVAAQAALLYGYYLWGGIKEVAAAALIALMSAFVAHAVAARFELRSLPPIVIAGGALVGVLSLGGALWHLPAMIVALLAATRVLPPLAVLGRAVLVAAGIGILAVPVIASGRLLPPTSSPLTDDDAKGNLIEPLEPLQAAGIWPAGDFRVDPVDETAAELLIAVVLLAAVAGLALAWRRRAWPLIAYSGGSIATCTLINVFGSPWVDGKALAIVSPAVMFAAALAAGLALSAASARARRLGGRIELAGAVGLALLLAGGVAWSNALAYRDANLAPRDQLAELEQIGERIAGEGPTLLTEYQPYGARHFLREADPEAVSELRRRRIPLANGEVVRKGESADTDALDPAALLGYRTLVLRRSPVQSRPPLAYRRIWRGDHYEVWQRPPGLAAALPRLGLGDASSAVAEPSCAEVIALARQAGESQRLVAARGRAPIYAAIAPGQLPEGWTPGAGPGELLPNGPGSLVAEVDLRRPGRYEVWLEGSVRPQVELLIDGEAAGSVRHQLNNQGSFVRLASRELSAGHHRLELRFHGADLAPGSGGAPNLVGPLILVPADSPPAELVAVRPSEARLLCGHRWDWIELARS